jgi:DNA polymerase III delta prime subunit
MPAPENLIGGCGKGTSGVCTFRSNFHLFLNNLGKTANDTILPFVDSRYRKAINVIQTKRKVFLYEVSQLSDRDEDRSLQLRQDLQRFLNLRQPIRPFIWFKPGKNHTEESVKQVVERDKIDICKHVKVKEELMKHAIQVSTWITKYFIDAEDVVVSSKDFLRARLDSWSIDPCIERETFDPFLPIQ